ncbi:MAG: TIGR04283 family arsenosugar biosynthesis glycosyltransferase [Vicinamibacterales bacterium]
MEGPSPLVSVVIPVRGDAGPLGRLLAQLTATPEVEVIVSAAADAGTGAATGPLHAARPDVRWVEGPAGRGTQLNRGAAGASGAWLWFVHADSVVPPGWLEAFRTLDAEAAVAGGSFRFRLDSPAWQARLLERGVALRVRLFDLPYGDQGIFARRAVFQSIGGFLPIPLMEDVEFIRRLKRHGRLAHLTLGLTTSARRWEARGWVRQSAANLATLGLYGLGVSPDRLARRYDPGTPFERGSSDADQADA